jgi:AraC-like DNA-binding protein
MQTENLKTYNEDEARVLFLEALDGLLGLPSAPLLDRLKIPHPMEFSVESKPYESHTTPELFIQGKGKTRIIFPSGSFELQEGDLCLVPRGLSHREESLNNQFDDYNFVLMLWPDALSYHVGSYGKVRDLDQRGFTAYPTAQIARLRAYLNDIVSIQYNTLPVDRKGLYGLFLLTLSLIRGIVTSHNKNASYSGHSKIAHCKAQVQLRIHESKLSVSLLADSVGCAPDYLSHLFHKETGVTLKNYITSQRIELAKGMLRRDSLSISEISYSIGFKHPSYFSKCFHAIVGKSPREFRSQGSYRK